MSFEISEDLFTGFVVLNDDVARAGNAVAVVDHSQFICDGCPAFPEFVVDERFNPFAVITWIAGFTNREQFHAVMDGVPPRFPDVLCLHDPFHLLLCFGVADGRDRRCGVAEALGDWVLVAVAMDLWKELQACHRFQAGGLWGR